MPVIKNRQFIKAPIELCFDLARNVDIHIQTTSETKERAVGGITEGLLEQGDTVTWEAIHFGVKQRLTAKVTIMEKPHKFVDVMVKGAFQSFVHTHQFFEQTDGTIMIDTFEYKSPLGIIGVVADKLFLEKYMSVFIATRAKELKKIAENIA
ncbi:MULTISPECIES: SRPBCC family protein [unclassified Bacillus (in: firmicutes)]|uniref:SRPBCC family protein n=1 Tax=unclassified Bacillus (in: firmicutes) TaxID=185979 RepID=UPI0008E25D7A|nr:MULTISPECIES: SRPBCC family protein [unclassified Bacillus (in: firmicutes)]SFA85155.1 Ligand-binding SRPBCC domain-containing protein [Bacillus sp. UNCCL13]SFQ83280.1 Ligand-binding SRPBCC domain-containing protein [Bacillus sp. cl95]